VPFGTAAAGPYDAGGEWVRQKERRKAPRYTDRLKSLTERLERLISESKQLRARLEARGRNVLARTNVLTPRETCVQLGARSR